MTNRVFRVRLRDMTPDLIVFAAEAADVLDVVRANAPRYLDARGYKATIPEVMGRIECIEEVDAFPAGIPMVPDAVSCPCGAV